MQLTLLIGTKNWSSWSLRPWLAARQSGLSFTEELVQLRHDNQEKSVKARSPSGLVPLLEVDGPAGRYQVWDSLAICEHLAELAPAAGLWPADPAARAVARSYCAEMHSGFAELRRQYTMEFARDLPGIAPTEGTRAAITRITKLWQDALNASGGPFLFGRFSIADAFFAPVVSRCRTYHVALPAPAAAYAAHVFAMDAMQDWLKAAQAEVAAGLAYTPG